MNDLSSPTDDNTSDDEEALRTVLRGAAADLAVGAFDPNRVATAPSGLAADAPRRRPTNRPNRKVMAVAASVAAVIVAGGAFWATSREDGVRRLVVGPSQDGATSTASIPVDDPADEVEWWAERGIWRLPEPRSGIDVAQAALTDAAAPPFLVALRRDDPSRFIAISAGGSDTPDFGAITRSSSTDASVSLRQHSPVDERTGPVVWSTAKRRASSIVVASTPADADAAWSLLVELASATDLTSTSLASAMTTVNLPEGFVAGWNLASTDVILNGTYGSASLGALHPALSFMVTTGGHELQVNVSPPAMTPQAATIAAALIFQPANGATTTIVDDGRGVFRAEVGRSLLWLVADDGTWISVVDTANGDEVDDDAVQAGLASVDDLLAVARSLRSVGEAKVRSTLAERGAGGLADRRSSALAPTTTTSTP